MTLKDAVLMVFLLKATMHIQLQLHRPEKGLRTTICNRLKLFIDGNALHNGLRVSCQ